MNKPIVINLPHKLGKEEAKRRMRKGVGKLGDQIPGGGDVESSWEEDRLNIRIKAMGQEVSGHIDAEESNVRLELMLPAFLGLFAGKVEGLLRNRAAAALEDNSKKKGDGAP